MRKIILKTFLRYENKYLLNENQYKSVLFYFQKHMNIDEYYGSKYRIYNIYYDTSNDDIIRKSLSKPYYKEKLRLRVQEWLRHQIVTLNSHRFLVF